MKLISIKNKATDTMENPSETVIQAMAARIDALEMRAVYQDAVIEDLNKMIIEQWHKIDQVAARIERLENRIRDAQETAVHNAYDEPPPPHY